MTINVGDIDPLNVVVAFEFVLGVGVVPLLDVGDVLDEGG